MKTLNTQLKARDVMIGEPACVGYSTTLKEIARLFQEKEISCAPIVDRRGGLMGVVSKSALIRRRSERATQISPAHLFEMIFAGGVADEASGGGDSFVPQVCVDEFMTRFPVTVTPDTPVTVLAGLLQDERIHRVIVVNEEKVPVGIITSSNLLRALSQPDPHDNRGRVEPLPTPHPYHYPWSL